MTVNSSSVQQNLSIKEKLKAKKNGTGELSHEIIDATPLICNLWDREHQNLYASNEALKLFDLSCKEEFINRFFDLSPKYQPNGRLSRELVGEYLNRAFEQGFCHFEWMHQKFNGEPMPCEITLVRIQHEGDFFVVSYTRDLREYKKVLKNIELRDNLLNTVNHTAVTLLSTENEISTNASIMEGMEILGRAVDVDRVQIWQNEIIDNVLHFVHKCEWRSEIGQQKIPVPIGLKYPYNEKPEWHSKFLRGEYINSLLRDLPKSDQDLLMPFEMKSIVIIPLFLQDRFWGFFSLDDCHNERTFTEEEINILRSGGLLVANAFLRNDMTRNIHTTAEKLKIALEKAQEANMAKSKFLATMSHEIRTPMNVILGVTESYLQDEKIKVEVREGFEKIYNAGDMLLHIINDILDLSKIEADKFEVISVKYDIMSLINDAAHMNIIRFQHKPIKFNLLVDENIPAELYGDELRIKQILNNLLSNAFKYTESGEVGLSFSIKKPAENPSDESGAAGQSSPTDKNINLVLRVSDTGNGMTTEQIEKIFDEYARFNLETNRPTIGTGLGMPITRNLVRLMKGELTIESEKGKGTVVTVCIPQVNNGSAAIGKSIAENLQNFIFSNTAQAKNKKITREPMPYGKVLVVDDMRTNLDVAILLLNPYQLQIDTAESGFEAIDLIKNGKEYDIIFMDHMMPVMDGMETTKKMRELGYKRPIFALTANAFAGQQEIFFANGFDGYISKPIDIRQLNDSLNKFIHDRHQHHH